MGDEAPTTTPRVVATMLSAEEMREALRQRFAEIGLSRGEDDRLARLPDGYCGKLFCEPPVKKMSIDGLFFLAAAAGCRFALIEDAHSMELIAKRARKRDAKKDTASAGMPKRTAQKMARLRVASQTPERRIEIARAAAVIRWERVKAAVREQKQSSAA